MKKKGFTLIELLAVIVILAIIGIITIPLIGNVIEESRTKAALISTNGYIKAIENELIISSKTNGEYKLSDINVSVNGEKAKQGYITIEEDQIKEAKFCIGKVSTDYDGKEVTISKNNYCSEDYEITLVVNGEKESKKIGTQNETEFTLSDISNMTNISCNNGSIPTIENNTLKVSSIYGNTTCVINSTLKETIDKLDNTETYIVMLNDEAVTNILGIKKDKSVTLDLNGKEVSTNQITLIINYGILNVKSSKNGGTMTSPSNVIFSHSTGITNVYSGSFINTASENDGRATIVVANGGNVNIYGDKATFDENSEYVSGTYLEGNGNSVANISSGGGTINIYNGTFKMNGTLAAIRSNVNSDNVLFNIYDGEIISNNSGISLDPNCIQTAQVNIYGGIINVDQFYAIHNNSVGTINIQGGIITSNISYTIYNRNNGIININQTSKPIYVSTLSQVWRPAILNSASGTINIVANQANACTNDSNDTTSGLCVYAEGDKNYSKDTSNTAIANTGAGIININGGTYFGGYIGVSNHFDGILNIANANISSGNDAINNMRAGIINLCNSKINSSEYDIWLAEAATGKINYSSNVVFTNGTNTPVIGGNTNNIIPNYNGTCMN